MSFSHIFYVFTCIVFVHIFDICSNVSVVFLYFCQVQIFLLCSHVCIVFTCFCCVHAFLMCSYFWIVFTRLYCVHILLLCLHVSFVFTCFCCVHNVCCVLHSVCPAVSFGEGGLKMQRKQEHRGLYKFLEWLFAILDSLLSWESSKFQLARVSLVCQHVSVFLHVFVWYCECLIVNCESDICTLCYNSSLKRGTLLFPLSEHLG